MLMIAPILKIFVQEAILDALKIVFAADLGS